MDAFTGKYYLQGGEPQEATILLLKEKISIGIKNEHDEPQVIFWPYQQIIKDNFWKRGLAIVRCGTYPVQIIEVEEKEFADKLESLLAHRNRSWYSRIMNKDMMGMVKVLLAFIAALLAIYFWVVPFLAERMAKRVPVSYEEKLGNGLYDVLKDGFVLDEAKTFYANEFFRELNFSSEYPIRITVVKEKNANAYAIPGGHIVIHDKILAGMNNYEDLAALLSHEFTHINEKHSTRSLFRHLGSGIFLSVIIGDMGAIANTILHNADNLKGLSYSRSLEKEADLNGLKLLGDRKIDCNGFIRLFEFLKKESPASGINSNEWASSHPDLDKRIEYIKNSELFNRNTPMQNEALKTLFMKIKTGD